MDIAGSVPATALSGANVGKMFTHISLSPNSIILLLHHVLEVNRHTMQHTGLVSMLLQLLLVSGKVPRNHRSVLPCGPNCISERTLLYFFSFRNNLVELEFI